METKAKEQQMTPNHVRIIELNDQNPAGLRIELDHSQNSQELPEHNLEFILLSCNNSRSYIGLFSFTSYGLEMRHSATISPSLATTIRSKTALIFEKGMDGEREYSVKIIHDETE